MKNWKTTLAGATLAALHVVVNGANWKQLALAALVAALGVIANDPAKNN
jgi:hypothetical protein